MSLLTDRLRDVADRVGYYDERGTWVNAEWMKDAAERLDAAEAVVGAAQAIWTHTYNGNVVTHESKVLAGLEIALHDWDHLVAAQTDV